MKKLKILIFASTAALLFCFSLKKGYYWLTDGFTLNNISYTRATSQEWQPPRLDRKVADEVDTALAQKYSYLCKGHQSYVFISDDQHYVIKFLKLQKYRAPPLLGLLPLPQSLEKILQNKKEHREKKCRELFESLKIAAVELADETQTLFLHFPATALPTARQLRMSDKMGVSYDLNLSEYPFLLQRKAVMLEATLKEAMEQREVRRAVELIDRLLSTYLNQYRRGLTERDLFIVRNTGVIANRPVQIDIGRFKRDENLKNAAAAVAMLAWKVSLFREWLQENHPELSNHLATRLLHLESIVQ